jgi:hypothetical protein
MKDCCIWGAAMVEGWEWMGGERQQQAMVGGGRQRRLGLGGGSSVGFLADTR